MKLQQKTLEGEDTLIQCSSCEHHGKVDNGFCYNHNIAVECTQKCKSCGVVVFKTTQIHARNHHNHLCPVSEQDIMRGETIIVGYLRKSRSNTTDKEHSCGHSKET